MSLKRFCRQTGKRRISGRLDRVEGSEHPFSPVRDRTIRPFVHSQLLATPLSYVQHLPHLTGIKLNAQTWLAAGVEFASEKEAMQWTRVASAMGPVKGGIKPT